MVSTFRVLCAGVLVALTPAALGDMTLNDAIVKALAHDPGVPKIHADVSEAVGFAREVKADLMPQLSIEGSGGPGFRERQTGGGETLMGRQGAVVGRQLLWDNGFAWNRWKDAKERLEAKNRLDKAQRERTGIGAVEAFLDVIRARRQIEYARQSVGAHERVFDLANKRAQAAGNQADIELSGARYSLAKNLLMERQLALREAEASFVRWIGEKPGDLVPPATPAISSISEVDPKQNFHYLATLKQRDAAVFQKRSLQGRYGPNFYLEGSAGIAQDIVGARGKDNDASVLVVGSWEILDGGRRKAQVDQAIADIDRQIAIMEETIVLLNEDITARWQDYRTIQQRLDLLRSYAGALGKTVNLYQQQFDLGTRPLLNLLDIQNEVISASIRIADGERDRTFLGYRLLFFGGKLLTETVGPEYLEGKPGQSTIKTIDGKKVMKASAVVTPKGSTVASQSSVKDASPKTAKGTKSPSAPAAKKPVEGSEKDSSKALIAKSGSAKGPSAPDVATPNLFRNSITLRNFPPVLASK